MAVTIEREKADDATSDLETDTFFQVFSSDKSSRSDNDSPSVCFLQMHKIFKAFRMHSKNVQKLGLDSEQRLYILSTELKILRLVIKCSILLTLDNFPDVKLHVEIWIFAGVAILYHHHQQKDLQQNSSG